jgi:hypothetical protein
MPDPNEIRFDIPHPARVWNYWLGGKDNYAPDRAVGDAIVAQNPDILHIARQARQFLIRAVTFLAGEAGIVQFLDIGRSRHRRASCTSTTTRWSWRTPGHCW